MRSGCGVLSNEAFAAHIGDRNARPLELKGCMVVGVSAAGEIAVLTNVRGFRESNWVQFGTLARAPIILSSAMTAGMSRL
jgi:hypothetical protein